MRPWAYPVELRERAVAACDRNDISVEEVAELFGIKRRTLYYWLARRREHKTLEPLAHGGGNPARVDAEGALVVRAIIAEEPDATAEEAAIYFVERTDNPCSRSSMVRAFKRLGITRKKSR
jgi:transposase